MKRTTGHEAGTPCAVEGRRRALFQRRLLAWYRRCGRHDLPWQRDRRAYAVWVSEIMLQQTTVETVRGYYDRFLERFPTVRALAEAERDEVLELWSGLGYYRRAHHLHEAARLVVERHGGRLPRRVEALEALPGIGPSTAGAIVSLVYDRPAVVLDTNVRRVLERFWRKELQRRGGGERALWALAQELLPKENGRAYTQGLMDLGALVCRPREPDCMRCPLGSACLGPGEGEGRRTTVRTSRRRGKRAFTFLLHRDTRGRVLLVRRPPEGIWAGLWCPPEAGESSVNLPRGEGAVLARRVHRLSHLDLEIRLVEPRTRYETAHYGPSPARRWVSARDLDRLALPPVVRAMLESLPLS